MSTTAKPIPAPAAPVVTQPARIAVARIHASPLNPRRVGEKERGALADSLRAQGQLVPLWVRPHREIAGGYELVDGERRWWGLQAVGIEEARVEVGDFSDEDILRITWTTGTEGKGLTAIEQAWWARAAMARAGATLDSVGALVGVQGSALRKRLLLLDLPAEIQDAVQAGTLPPMTAFLIAGVPGAAQERFAHEVLHPDDEEGPLSYAAAETLRRASYARTLKAAPFDPEDAGLVPHAGACSTCRFRAGNNVQEYGPTKSPNTCMHVACFAEKETAARARAVAKEAGKVALSAEENAMVFPEGAVEPSAASGYVAATRPIPADLVKDEVTAQGAPTFAEVSPAARVYVGTDGHGRLVDLVEVAEAITAATEPSIFRAEVVASYGLRDNEAGHHRNSDDEVVNTPALRDVAPAKAEPTKGSIAGEQKRAAKAEKAAEKSKAKKLRECAEWMLDLFESLSAPEALKPAGYAYTRASLKWEHLIRSVPDEDALLVLHALSEDDPAKGQTGKDALKEFVAGIGGAGELDAVCDLLLIASTLRAQGAQVEWVVDWDRHLVKPLGTKPAGGVAAADAAAEKIAREEQNAKLTAIARAHAEGMPLREIARSFALPLPEVCGMLEVPVPADDAVVAASPIFSPGEQVEWGNGDDEHHGTVITRAEYEANGTSWQAGWADSVPIRCSTSKTGNFLRVVEASALSSRMLRPPQSEPHGVDKEKADLIVTEFYAGQWLHEIVQRHGVERARVRAVLHAAGLVDEDMETAAESEVHVRKDIDALWAYIGYKKASERDAVAKLACKVTWAKVESLEQLQRVYDALCRIKQAKTDKEQKDSAKTEERGE